VHLYCITSNGTALLINAVYSGSGHDLAGHQRGKATAAMPFPRRCSALDQLDDLIFVSLANWMPTAQKPASARSSTRRPTWAGCGAARPFELQVAQAQAGRIFRDPLDRGGGIADHDRFPRVRRAGRLGPGPSAAIRPFVELGREPPERCAGHFKDQQALGTFQPESNGTAARKNGNVRGVYAKAPVIGAAPQLNGGVADAHCGTR